MLRLLPDRLLIQLSSQACRVSNLPRWGEKTTVNEVELSMPSDYQGPRWLPAIDAFERVIAERGGARSELNIVLADEFVRFVALPWSNELRNAREVYGLAVARFEEVYGNSVHDWHIRADMPEYGRGGLACAVDIDLVDSLRVITDRKNLRIHSLASHFVRVINRYRKQFPRDGILAVGLDDSWTIACRQGDCWRSVRSSTGDFIRTSVRERLQRELLWLGLGEEVPMYLYSSSQLGPQSLEQEVTILANNLSPNGEAVR